MGAFGVEYSAGRHFAVYGEGALAVARSASDARVGDFRTERDVTRVRARGSVGVILRL